VARWKIYEVLERAPLVEPPPERAGGCSTGFSHKQWLPAVGGPGSDDASAPRPAPWSTGGPGRLGPPPGRAEARFTPKKSLPAVAVSTIKSNDDSVSFDVSQPGVPGDGQDLVLSPTGRRAAPKGPLAGDPQT